MESEERGCRRRSRAVFWGRGVVREEGSEGRSGCGEESVRGSTSGALPLSPPARPTAEHHPFTHGIFLCGGVVGCFDAQDPESIDWRNLWKCGIVFCSTLNCFQLFKFKCCSPTAVATAVVGLLLLTAYSCILSSLNLRNPLRMKLAHESVEMAK